MLMPKQDYINGCYTKYGTRPMNTFERKIRLDLPSGMVCFIGYIDSDKDGLSADVYRDKKLSELLFMEHGYSISLDIPQNPKEWEDVAEMLSPLIYDRLHEMRLG